MTQMGLEYMKHKETGRHNVADEGIRSDANVISAQDANTRSYTASFKPQEVSIAQDQARASLSQADTAQGRLGLDSRYRERETVAKEISSDAAKSQAGSAQQQANVATGRLGLDTAYRERETLAKEDQSQASIAQAIAANKQAKSSEKQAEASLLQALTGQERAVIEKVKVIADHLSGPDAALYASKYAGDTDFNAQIAAFNSILEKLLPQVKYSASYSSK